MERARSHLLLFGPMVEVTVILRMNEPLAADGLAFLRALITQHVLGQLSILNETFPRGT